MHAGWSCARLNDGPNIKVVELCTLARDELCFVCCLVIRGSGVEKGAMGLVGGFLLFRYFGGVTIRCFCRVLTSDSS